MNGSLAEIRDRSRLVVLVGEGGVGKTSCAAGLALATAAAGRNTAVLTIDPAPRLGDALGVVQINSSPQVVETAEIAAAGGRLAALRLDTQGTFDGVVERLSPSPEAARAILESPIYRAISGSLGGSEAYMALQQLFEIQESGDYESLVVDTPPAVHARELLSAPSRLAALVETDAARVLANPTVALTRAGSSVARRAAALVLPVLERVTGLALRSQVADFITGFERVIVGLAERARIVEHLLRAEDTSFVIVARPVTAGVNAALSLERSLGEFGIRADALIVNRLTPAPGSERQRPRAERMAGAPPGTSEAVEQMERDMDAMRAAEAEAVQALRETIASRRADVPIVELAALEHDIASLGDLAVLSRALCGSVGRTEARESPL